MTRKSRSAKLFLERRGLRTTWRRPLPTFDTEAALLGGVPGAPLPRNTQTREGAVPPDRGQTLPWPWEDGST